MAYVPLLIVPLVFGLVAILGLAWVRPARPGWIIASALYVMLDEAVTMAMPNPFHWHWNWLGKAASISLALGVIAICRLGCGEIGLVTPKVGTLRRATTLGVAAVILSVIANYLTRDHHSPSIETVAYEATMPGLSEELVFRGVLVALFIRAYPIGIAGVILAGAASTLIFGLGHGVTYDGAWHLAWLPIAFAAVIGAILMAMRVLTGSVFPSMLVHNATNVLGDVANAAP